MSTDPGGADLDGVAAALSGPLARRIDTFRYDVAAGGWWWSDELYRIFGFEPGQVVPTAALIAAHVHPDDRRRHGRASGLGAVPVASVHRIVDAHGDECVVAVLAVSRRDASGATTQVGGYVADVTGAVRALAAPEATRRIHDPQDDQIVVDQAVGIITATTGRTPGAALALLRAASTRRHLSRRQFAERIIAAAAAVAQSESTPAGSRTDPLDTLLTPRELPPRPHEPPAPENGATGA